jgi:sporulation protein YlmC with PRC-barrel domain
MLRTLEGDVVVGGDGARLGTIAELLLDLRRGEVAYALIAPAPGARTLHAVPWSAIALDASTDALTLRNGLGAHP